MPHRREILDIALKMTSEERNKAYGDPNPNMSCGGDLKRTFRFYNASSGRSLSAGEQEAIDMVLTKISRIATGPVVTMDTYVDAAAYMAIAGELASSPEEIGELTKDVYDR